jgi:2,4-dienoyl-CoA reductase-like NADH-dependent reductase (Old Yellow Enzyme family)
MPSPHHPLQLAWLARAGTLGSLRLRNRMIASPLHTGLCDAQGRVTDELVEHYRRRAEGGAALVIIEYAHIDGLSSKVEPFQLAAHEDAAIAGLQRIARAIQAEGALAGAQLAHAGRQRVLLEGRVVAPSVVPWPLQQAMGAPLPEALGQTEISGIVASFAAAARRVRQAGFDMVEIHGGHGYLIAQFLSAHTNRRRDRYGGPLERRQALLRQVVLAVREEVGSDYPISVRLSHCELVPNGITLEETVATARMLEKAGVASIDISAGNHQSRITVQSMYLERAYNIAAAARVRSEVQLAVSAVGSFNAPADAANALAHGHVDFVRLGRPLLADPDFPRKVVAGEAGQIRPCIRCNECLERGVFLHKPVVCAVNAAAGSGALRTATGRSARRLRFLVIGAGAGGLEAARLALSRGHEVVLAENGEIGGALARLSRSASKRDIADYLHYLLSAVKNHVDLLARTIDAEAAAALEWDAAIVATGAVARTAPFTGAHKANVVDAWECFNRKLGGELLVVGASQNAADVALHLLQQGCRVTVVCSKAELATDMGAYSRQQMINLLHGFQRLRVLTNAHLWAAQGSHCIIRFDGGSEWAGTFDTIVDTEQVGSPAFRGLASIDRRMVMRIGDCVQPRRIYDAVHEATRAVIDVERKHSI